MAKNISSRTKSDGAPIHVKGGITVSAVCLGVLLLAAGPAQGLEPQWPAGPYRYIVLDQDVRDIVAEFGRNLNITIKVSEKVNPRRIRGRLPASGAKEFLNRLCESYGLVWYYDGAVLHISDSSEVRTELVDLGTVSPSSVNERLRSLGIVDSRYQIRSTQDARLLSVSGPPPYLALIRQTVAVVQKAGRPSNIREDSDGDDKSVRVFRGKGG